MPIKTLDLTPANNGAPFAVAIRQPSGSVIRPTVIIRARMQVRLQGLLFQTMVEVGRRVIGAPAVANAVGERWVAIGAVPGSDRYEVECNVADLLTDGIVLQAGPYKSLDEPLTWIEYTPVGLVIGSSTVAELAISPIGSGVMSVGVEQGDASTDDVLVIIEAATQTGFVEVGRRVFDAPAPGPGRRLVALVSIPGSLGYRVTARSADGARPYVQAGPYENMEEPLTWVIDGQPVPPGTGAQPASLIWVATNGDDATGERGNIDRPFATVQGAIDAAQSGDSILIAPGDYTAGAVIPATASLTIEGLGSPESVRIAPASGVVLSWAPDANNVLALRNLGLITGDASPALSVLASAPANAATLAAEGVSVQSAGAAEAFCSGLAVYRLAGCAGAWAFEECDGGNVYDHEGDFSDVVSDPVPANVTRGLARVTGSNLFSAVVAGNAQVEFSASSKVNLLNHGALGFLAAAGVLVFRGEVEFPVLAALSDLADFDFQDAKITGELIFANLSVNPIIFDAQGATVKQFDIAATGDTTLDTRGGTVSNVGSSAAVGPFFWDRDGGGDEVTLAPGANALAFGVELAGFNYPSGSQPVFSVTPSTVPVVAGDGVTATALANTGFTAVSGYGAPEDVSITYNRSYTLCPIPSPRRRSKTTRRTPPRRTPPRPPPRPHRRSKTPRPPRPPAVSSSMPSSSP